MNESENVYQSKMIWKYIEENPKLVGIQVSDKQGLDILNALKDIYETLDDNLEMGKDMLTMLAGVILASAQGQGDKIVNEVMVQEAMSRFDSSMKDILNEK